MAAKQLRRTVREAEEHAAQEAERRRAEEEVRRVQAVLSQGAPRQWHGLRKHEW